MDSQRFTTQGGLIIEARHRDLEPGTAIRPLFEKIDFQRGAIFSSGFDYPGRHSRWDIGFVDPALEFLSRARDFELRALNAKGSILVSEMYRALSNHPHVESIAFDGDLAKGRVKPLPEMFTEEERSRQPSVFSVLRAIVELFRSEHPAADHFGLYGAFGYDLVLQFEQLKLKHVRDPQSIDCHLFLPLELIVVDRKREVAALVTYEVETGSGATADQAGGGQTFPAVAGAGNREVICDHASGEFAKKVDTVIEGTKRGDYFEVVLSQSFETRQDDPPTVLFQRLAKINPSPYMFLVNFGGEQLMGASPEIYVRVTGKRYETCPIAGTISRGETALEDADRVMELMSSKKDESELTMCTDVDRNDMARVCEPGSVRVIGRRQLEFYSHLIHTVDHVEGQLRSEFDALDAFQTHMWACTVTGAPKPAALQEIENLEASPRGWYSGAIGLLCFNGNVNTGITLRSAVLKNGRARTRAGATLLFGSDPSAEERETRTKAAAFLSALTHKPPTLEALAENKHSASHAPLGRKLVLLIDYKDSFVHNLASYLRELGAEVVTMRCGFPVEMLDKLSPDLVLLSPGPGTPADFGVPDFVGLLAERRLPTFGVCLGHQGIGQHFGGTIEVLPLPEHGKTSLVTHAEHELFLSVDKEFEAGRYHSLYIADNSVPKCLEVIAWTKGQTSRGTVERIPMAFCHSTLPIASVQFHPESLMTLKGRAGHHILANALRILKR